MSSIARQQLKFGHLKRHDWRARLNWWLAENRHSDMVYGQSDCALTAADAIQVQTGFDPAVNLRGKYNTEQGAAKIIKRKKGLPGLVTSLIGPPLDNHLMARTGDIALIFQHLKVDDKVVETPCLGVIMEEKVWIRSATGMEPRSRTEIVTAWPVGRDA